MTYCDNMRVSRASLRELESALAPVQAGVASNEAAAMIGQARGLLRAAEQKLGVAMREEEPRETAAQPGPTL